MKKIMCLVMVLVFSISVSACSFMQVQNVTELTLKSSDLAIQYETMTAEFDKYFAMLSVEEQDTVTRADMVIRQAINEVKEFSIRKDYSKLTIARLTRTVNSVVFEYANIKKIVTANWDKFSVSEQAKLSTFDSEAVELYAELTEFAADPTNAKSIETAGKLAAMGILLAKSAEIVIPIVAAQMGK